MDIRLLDEIYDSLKKANEDLYDRYIDKYIKVFCDVDDFKLDTRTYCVLLHAALEGFIEDVSFFTSKYSFFLFKEKGEVTIPFMFFLNGTNLCNSRLLSKSEKSEDDDGVHIGEHVIEFIFDSEDKANTLWMGKINSNHGIKSKHLNSIIQALGIHFDKSDLNFDSWESFAQYRGSFAHSNADYLAGTSGETAIKELSPEDAKKKGRECVDFALTIIEEAKNMLSGSAYVKDFIMQMVEKRTAKDSHKLELARLATQREAKATATKKAESEKIAAEKEQRRLKNIERTRKLDLIIGHIQTNQEKYGDLHSILFSEQ